MFRKFENKKRVAYCDNDNSLKNIICFGGVFHTNNIMHFLYKVMGVSPKFSFQNINVEKRLNKNISIKSIFKVEKYKFV